MGHIQKLTKIWLSKGAYYVLSLENKTLYIQCVTSDMFETTF